MKHFSFGKFLAHFFLLIIVFIWVIPTFGLLISSLRDKDQVALTGWWTALKHNEFNEIVRTEKSAVQIEENGVFIITGNLLKNAPSKSVINFGITSKNPKAFEAPSKVTMKNGSTFYLQKDGSYRWTSDKKFKHKKGKRIFLMSPIHHHYQKKGIHEAKIVARFWIIGILLAVLSIVTLKLR